MILPGVHQPSSNQTIIYGQPVSQALPALLKQFWVSQAILVTNTSLAKPGGLAEAITAILGPAAEAFVSGVRSQTPRADVIRIAGSLRGRGTEALVTLGGGSVVEAAKVARICLTNNVGDVADIDRLRSATTAASPRPYLISIPTTLSGAEYTPHAGVTDEVTGRKDVFYHKDLAPDAVLLDPAMTLATPKRLWLSSGIRALDHAIESWCSPATTPYADACALYAARLLAPGLVRSQLVDDDLEARLQCQVGSWFAVQGAAGGVAYGASHVIGSALTAEAGMPHGETSCIMLPHVLRYNAAMNMARQTVLAATIGDAQRPLADLVADLVRQLGLPSRLREAGVPEGTLPQIAAAAFGKPGLAANPRPIAGAAGVLELLRAAW